MSAIFFPTFAKRTGTITLLLCGALWGQSPLRADGSADAKPTADGKTPAGVTAEEEPADKNWIEFGIGGLIIHGDEAQYSQEHRQSGPVYGGIQDLHFEQTVGKNAQFTIDGHALFDQHDYDVKLELSQPDLGYIQAGYTEFRSWYDGNGGFFPVNGQFFPPPFPDMTLDRGEAWIEFGLRKPDWPEITIRYSHLFRSGQKDSTIWGDTNQTGLTTGQTERKIAPAFRDIDETRDIVSLEATKTFGKTDVGLGMRYEHDSNDDSLNLWRGAGNVPPAVPPPGNQRFVTEKSTDDVNLFSGHATTVTRFSDSFWLTTAYAYTTLTDDIGGSRIYGTTYNAAYSDPVPTLGARDHGFLNLAGTTQLNQWVINLNTMWVPFKDLTVLSAFRFTWENKQSDAVYLDTTTRDIPPIPHASNSFEDINTFAQTLDVRYTGITNWVFYAQGDWEEQYGDIHESESEIDTPPINGIKNLNLLWQKYAAGFNWYPLDRVNLSAQYFYKSLQYDNQSTVDGQQLVNQEWDTNDVNVRLSWRPRLPSCMGVLALVTRYDYATVSVYGQWAAPDSPPFQSLRTALITNQVITESLTWNPSARLYLQANLSYVLSKTNTPADYNITPNTIPTVLDFTNDYWTAGGAVGFALDKDTDLRVEYSHYRADNYVNNALAGVPYGLSATEDSVSASIGRQITKHVRLRLQYSYFNYTDETSGNHNNYQAHSIFSSLLFGF